MTDRTKIHPDWYSNFQDEKTRQEFMQLLLTSAVTKQLTRIINKRYGAIVRKETNEDDFNNPNWAERQAFRNGYMSCIKEFQELVNFIEE